MRWERLCTNDGYRNHDPPWTPPIILGTPGNRGGGAGFLGVRVRVEKGFTWDSKGKVPGCGLRPISASFLPSKRSLGSPIGLWSHEPGATVIHLPDAVKQSVTHLNPNPQPLLWAAPPRDPEGHA